MLDKPVDLDAQIDILSKYVVCSKNTELKPLLNYAGYFSVSQYAKFALSRSNALGAKPTAKLLINIYNFDNLLKSILFTYCKKIELTFKNTLSDALSKHTGTTMFYLDKNYYTPSQGEYNKSKRSKNINFFETFFNSIIEEEKNMHKNIQKYPEFSEIRYQMKKSNIQTLPCWAVFPYFDFGTIINIFFYLNGNLRIETLKYTFSKNKYTKHSTKEVDTWLSSIRNLRNTCAHNGQLVGKTSNIITAEPSESNLLISNCDLFSRLYSLKKLLSKKDGQKLACDIQKIIAKTHIDVHVLGILPKDWDKLYASIKIF